MPPPHTSLPVYPLQQAQVIPCLAAADACAEGAEIGIGGWLMSSVALPPSRVRSSPSPVLRPPNSHVQAGTNSLFTTVWLSYFLRHVAPWARAHAVTVRVSRRRAIVSRAEKSNSYQFSSLFVFRTKAPTLGQKDVSTGLLRKPKKGVLSRNRPQALEERGQPPTS